MCCNIPITICSEADDEQSDWPGNQTNAAGSDDDDADEDPDRGEDEASADRRLSAFLASLEGAGLGASGGGAVPFGNNQVGD
jgi:hypothetical protein